jgi:ribonucrease Y
MYSLKLIAVFLAIAGLVGIAVGYYLRLIISLGKKGSMELEIKEMLLAAKEEAKRITADAELKAKERLEEAKKEIKEKEDTIKQTESRLIKKEDFLDKRQSDIDKEVELVKQRVAEIKAIREKADKLEQDRLQALEKISQLTAEEAKRELILLIEKQSEQDLLVRMNKLEAQGEDRGKKCSRREPKISWPFLSSVWLHQLHPM